MPGFEERRKMMPKPGGFHMESSYFSKKIKKTVKKYFQARRKSTGIDFDSSDYGKDHRVCDGIKSEMKNHKVNIELDPVCDVSEKSTWGKGISSKVLAKLNIYGTYSNRETPGLASFEDGIKKEVKKRFGKKGFFKVDMGLQTEEVMSRESARKGNYSKIVVQDDLVEISHKV